MRYSVLPTELANHIGDRRAYILSQIHYWCEINKKNKKNYTDNRYWCRRSVADFKANDFPFLTKNTISNALDKLKEDGLLLVTKLKNTGRTDNTNAYSVDYDVLLEKYNFKFGERLTEEGIPKNWVMATQKLGNDYPKIGETLKDTIKDNKKNINKDTILYSTKEKDSKVEDGKLYNDSFIKFKQNTEMADRSLTNTEQQVLDIVEEFYRRKEGVYINSIPRTFEQVNEKIQKLDRTYIEYVCESIENYTESIERPYSFILTIMYNADINKNTYYQNQIKIDRANFNYEIDYDID